MRVSPACEHCYAEAWAKRLGKDVWGVKKTRRFFGDAHWREPEKWNRVASETGRRARVFCASMADVFELRAELDPQRKRLWSLIRDTPYLDWLLLTKRPENVARMAPWRGDWPSNVWLGTTVENQEYAERRLPSLLAAPAAIHFVSCEPLLGALDLRPWLRRAQSTRAAIDWVIVGGESGGGARRMDPVWARSLRDQCVDTRVPFHFKQWGVWGPASRHVVDASSLVRMGKGRAGRVLDGRTWDGVPRS